jgi:predicted Ser/Thr protein kinase
MDVLIIHREGGRCNKKKGHHLQQCWHGNMQSEHLERVAEDTARMDGQLMALA